MKTLFKKSLLSLALLGLAGSAFADAKAVQELQNRLDKVSQYTADFSQTVRSSKGKEVQSGSGKLQIKRPNLFRMDTKSPNENLIVSDGKDVWFYDPFVSQVTVDTVKKAVNSTPFVLLTSNDKAHWGLYNVTQSNDTFVLKPKLKGNLKQFDIRVDENGLVKGFSSIERDGQSNLYILRGITTKDIPANQFRFSPPTGTQVDDQRRSNDNKLR